MIEEPNPRHLKVVCTWLNKTPTCSELEYVLVPLCITASEILNIYYRIYQPTTLVPSPSTAEDITEDVGFASLGPLTLEHLFGVGVEHEIEMGRYQS